MTVSMTIFVFPLKMMYLKSKSLPGVVRRMSEVWRDLRRQFHQLRTCKAWTFAQPGGEIKMIFRYLDAFFIGILHAWVPQSHSCYQFQHVWKKVL